MCLGNYWGGCLWALISGHSQGSLLKVDVQGEIRLKSFLPSGSGEKFAGWAKGWVWDSLLDDMCGGIWWPFLI